MLLAKLLEIQPGVTAIIGGGGKTTLLRTLGEELAREHRVLLCTTTKMFPYEDLPCAKSREELEQLHADHSLLCAGTDVPGTGKITAPDVELAQLAAWFDYVLVEADGSAQRPLKAHAPHEPVIPPEANQVICVVGLSGLGQPIETAAHRPERYARLADVSEKETVTPQIAALVLNDEFTHVRYFLNQADTKELREQGRALAALLDCPAVLGSLQKGVYELC